MPLPSGYWTPERRRAQAERQRARMAELTPEAMAERQRKRLASRAAACERRKREHCAGPSPGHRPWTPAVSEGVDRGTGEASESGRPPAATDAGRPGGDALHSRQAGCRQIGGPASARRQPSCPLLGALLGQVVQAVTEQTPQAGATGTPLEAEVLERALELVEHVGSDGLGWFQAYAAFFRAARALAAERRRGRPTAVVRG